MISYDKGRFRRISTDCLFVIMRGAIKLIRRIPTVAFGGFLVVPALLVGEPSIDFAGTDDETLFVLNTFSFLIWGALVMWMCAGFHDA